MARLAGIKYDLAMRGTVDEADIAWLIELIESTEWWRRKEIDAADRAYQCAPLGLRDAPGLTTLHATHERL